MVSTAILSEAKIKHRDGYTSIARYEHCSNRGVRVLTDARYENFVKTSGGARDSKILYTYTLSLLGLQVTQNVRGMRMLEDDKNIARPICIWCDTNLKHN